MKNSRGITLIALIITIIVLLILVAVTVTFALQGGLFNNAKEAAKETEKRAIYEIITGSMELEEYGDDTFQAGEIRVYDTAVAAKNALINAGYEDGKISYEPNNTSATQIVMTVQGNHGTWKYKITTNKITIDDGNSLEKVAHLYIENYNMDFYKAGNLIYFNMDDKWYYTEIENDGTIENSGSAAIEQELGISNVSSNTPTYLAIGSLMLIEINDNWYYYNKEPWSFIEFDVVDFDTSVFETATKYGDNFPYGVMFSCIKDWRNEYIFIIFNDDGTMNRYSGTWRNGNKTMFDTVEGTEISDFDVDIEAYTFYLDDKDNIIDDCIEELEQLALESPDDAEWYNELSNLMENYRDNDEIYDKMIVINIEDDDVPLSYRVSAISNDFEHLEYLVFEPDEVDVEEKFNGTHLEGLLYLLNNAESSQH